jgi:hypothetical protein
MQPFATGIPHMYLVGTVDHRESGDDLGPEKKLGLSRHYSLLSMHPRRPLSGKKTFPLAQRAAQ